MGILETVLSFIWPYIPNILWIILVVVLTKIVLRFFNDIMRYLYRKYKIPKRNYLIIRNLALFGVYFTAVVLVLLSIPGVDEKVLTFLGIGIGVLVSLSSTSTIGNIVAGAIIHLTRPVMEGDRIELQGVVGDVVSIEMLFIHVKTIQNEIVSIPNLQVLTNRITNYSQMENVAIPVSVSIGYNVGSMKVKTLLVKAALETEGIIPKPEPFILIKDLGDHSVKYELNAFTQQHHGLLEIESNLRESILKVFNKESVEILSPMYVNTLGRAAGERVLARKEDSEVKQHKIVEEEEKIEELHDVKKKLEEKKRSPTTIEEMRREQRLHKR